MKESPRLLDLVSGIRSEHLLYSSDSSEDGTRYLTSGSRTFTVSVPAPNVWDSFFYLVSQHVWGLDASTNSQPCNLT